MLKTVSQPVIASGRLIAGAAWMTVAFALIECARFLALPAHFV